MTVSDIGITGFMLPFLALFFSPLVGFSLGIVTVWLMDLLLAQRSPASRRIVLWRRACLNVRLSPVDMEKKVGKGMVSLLESLEQQRSGDE
jgi:hypothetical protein